MTQIFVTGGSGFIGQRLVKRLVAEGHTVKGLARSRRSAQILTELGATPTFGELADASTWQDDVEGSDVVFHLAAETDINADTARHHFVTVTGTEQVLSAARGAGVTNFVHCGSEAALLAGDPLVDVDETAPLRPDSEAAYCAAKARAEQLVLDSNGPSFSAVSIRPRFVWGPRSSLIQTLVGAANDGAFAWIEGGRFKTDVTYVDNAVEGLMLGWLRGHPGEAYFITDRTPVVLRDFLEEQFNLHGVTADVPEIDAATAAAVVPAPARWFVGQQCTLRTEKAVKQLGYAPVVSHQVGLEQVRESIASPR